MFYTVFLIVTAVKEKVEERDRCFMGVQIHGIYKPEGQNYNFNECGLINHSETSNSYLVSL